MGTAEFAIPSLTLLTQHHDIISVVTAPDKPKGRGLQIQSSPIKDVSIKLGLPILQPINLKDQSFLESIKLLSPDIIVVVAFRILPPEVFQLPRFGSINLHASLLPKYRGAAPINWAIMNGESETGVTTFYLKEKVDEGDIILQARVKIRESETAGELHDALSDIGSEIVLHSINLIESRTVNLQKQDGSLVSFAPKIYKEQCKINWATDAKKVHNFIRGLSPMHCAYTFYQGTNVKIFRSQLTEIQTDSEPGTIITADDKLLIATNNNAIEILELQREGKRKMSVTEFLRGSPLELGKKFL
ncbi:MAG: methionyl-tRNA formyltransferase [Ignavibacteriales bacterium]|nr:methionyl-tRNA formyltransferase [Ignavibacteriales bacterium]